MEKLLTVGELAELLGINSGSLYHWVSEGRLPVVRFSKRCIRFRESEIQELLKQLTEASPVVATRARKPIDASKSKDPNLRPKIDCNYKKEKHT